ncbi:MAG: coenzyme F420-0:L-glutamate ligase [Acetivibrionales bacterium]
MKVTAVKTKLLEADKCALQEVLSESVDKLKERSIVAISSKVISLCEGNVLPLKDLSKDELIEKEADSFIPRKYSKYGVYLTIKNGFLVPSAGIDESNTNGNYVMWPKNPQESANNCWKFLRERYGIKNVGVIITDSITSPLKWGVTGKAIAHCGFVSVNSKIGDKDLFNKRLRQTRINIADGLAASAVLCMGESIEQTPVAIIEDVPFVVFQDHVPSPEELKSLRIDIKDDLYAPLLENAPWEH